MQTHFHKYFKIITLISYITNIYKLKLIPLTNIIINITHNSRDERSIRNVNIMFVDDKLNKLYITVCTDSKSFCVYPTGLATGRYP